MWDFRISADSTNREDITKQMKQIAKKYCFQLEKGAETGYEHFQGRLSLIKKHRKSELLQMFKEMPVPNYLEPTVNATALTGDMFYVTKHETRIDGPWDERVVEQYIPRQYRNLLGKLYPYQQQIYDTASNFNTRTINMIYCTKGNQGKSTVAALCELFGKGVDLPPVNDAEKLIQSLCDICEAKNMRDPSPVFVDLPRAMNKERLNGIYTAIEQIKKGKLYDTRYRYKDYWIDSPQIWVFSNIEPDLSMLSLDRWRIWTINDNKELERYNCV